MESPGDRIERLRKDAEISQAELAKRAKVSQQSLNNFINGNTRTLRGIERVARELGTSADYLLTGTGAEPAGLDAAHYVTLPRIDPTRRDAAPVGWWKLRRALVEDMGLPTDGLGVYRATSQDSIAGMIGARDLVIVDQHVGAVEREGVYLVDLDGATRLRLCSRDFTTGALIVSPSLPGVPPQTIPVPQLARARVLGRAVYRMGELP
jgi:transcriptional regulator with XRE-family HTH domain